MPWTSCWRRSWWSGGVVGAQFGVRAGAKLRGEQMRLLLALLVLAVARRLLWGLVVPPSDVYSLSLGVMMRRCPASCMPAGRGAGRRPRNLVSGVSQDMIQITSNYTGSDIVVFGAVEGQQSGARAATSWWWCADPTPT